MDVKSIPAVGADRESAVSDYKYASSRTSPFCATSSAGVVRVTEASCKCINTLFAYTAGVKFWFAKVRGGGKGRGTIRENRRDYNSGVNTGRKKLKRVILKLKILIHLIKGKIKNVYQLACID